MLQVEVAELEDADHLRTLLREVSVVVEGAVLVLLEEGGEPPPLVADLDGAVVEGLDLDALAPGIRERSPQAAAADDARDLLIRGHLLALGVDVGETGRAGEGQLGLGLEHRRVVGPGDDAEVALLAVRSEVVHLVLPRGLVDLDSPLTELIDVHT